MSRAFVNEGAFVAEMPERPISEHPNLVTEEGLKLIDDFLAAARKSYGEAQHAGDREALAQFGRDVRYWSARRGSAQVQLHLPSPVVAFGSAVTIVRDDGRRQTFRIVGEDEANPSEGTISYVSPLARALLGKSVGDVISAGTGEAEIVSLK